MSCTVLKCVTRSVVKPLTQTLNNCLESGRFPDVLKVVRFLLCTFSPVEERDSAVKLLGFWVDPKLSWHRHTGQVCVRLSRVLHLLRKLRTRLNKFFFSDSVPRSFSQCRIIWNSYLGSL